MKRTVRWAKATCRLDVCSKQLDWWSGALSTVLVLWAAFGLVGCGSSESLPNPVVSKDGESYIPIDDTAFLIPNKTWLRGYSRKSTDGSVSTITLHATIPDVQPWSPERDAEMYWEAGPGKKLLIYIKGGSTYQAPILPDAPNSARQQATFVEEPSRLHDQGLRQFRELWGYYETEAAEEKAIERFGREFVERRREKAGTPKMYVVFYELIEEDRVKYFIRCDDDSNGLYQDCHLLFPLGKTLLVDVIFMRDHIQHIVSMADKLRAQLREFEAAGRARRVALEGQVKVQ